MGSEWSATRARSLNIIHRWEVKVSKYTFFTEFPPQDPYAPSPGQAAEVVDGGHEEGEVQVSRYDSRTMSTFGTDPLVDFVNLFCKKVDFSPDFCVTLVASFWAIIIKILLSDVRPR